MIGALSSEQTMPVCHSFNVTNGVRQGGILSPHLFAIYDDLSIHYNFELCKYRLFFWRYSY